MPPALSDPALRAELRAVAHAMADAARMTTLGHFRSRGLRAESKEAARFDPVTIADRETEAAMRAVLAARRPEDAILGEEYAPTAGRTGLTWVIDPIDGTRSYMSGTPVWGVLIAVCDAGGPVYGLIDQPFTGERFEGGLGQAGMVWPGGAAALGTRTTGQLGDAILFSTFPEVGTPAERAGFEAVARRVRLTRYGMDCYAYALVALGQIDLVIEAGLEAYDVCAPIAVIEAAGGVVTDWRGRRAHGGGRILAAANPALHAEALALLAEVPEG
ncbi:MAG: hypothetical protein RLZ26_1504 [Pseudomonadota bacterium]|jgi:histidinol phosphatase-like enzyme (inositol monophosphatase family)